MANVIRFPAAFALSTIGFRSFGVLTPACLSLLLRLIPCPFLLIIHGMTIGLTGDPRRPIVDAKGIPISMWVAWFSPRFILSRMTAHEASFETTELIPNFLK